MKFPMRIYFSGSIRGSEEDVKIYHKLIAALQNYGDVLTEHLGRHLLTAKGQSHFSDKFVHDRDIGWLKSSDLIVADTSIPSLGVGYELAYAEQLQIPAIVLNNPKHKNLSAMIKGSQYFNYHQYHNTSEAIEIINQEVPKYQKQIKR
ncbi:hypothetical protein WR164_03860 [Philodulcilactobacillus myokoensis]|uniref:Putative 2'-deoxynucleoside 5'-phosphate N-hydrolase 1 n=2 Tax=Philodulcilactobacillus myokoensis TaxID=2929573 RepID=A0A9W6B053_9LACO|nr:hypothetical protein WR164_03860 [Philodulcilactobacillus myokoensis]